MMRTPIDVKFWRNLNYFPSFLLSVFLSLMVKQHGKLHLSLTSRQILKGTSRPRHDGWVHNICLGTKHLFMHGVVMLVPFHSDSFYFKPGKWIIWIPRSCLVGQAGERTLIVIPGLLTLSTAPLTQTFLPHATSVPWGFAPFKFWHNHWLHHHFPWHAFRIRVVSHLRR